ncbi:MAG: glycoside hydrolase family 5 protein [Fibrobacterales bacterium]
MKNIFLLGLALMLGATVHAKSIVEVYGQLSVDGQYMVNESGDPIALPGVSLFWSGDSEQYYNRSVIDYFVDEWKVTVVRAAMDSHAYRDSSDVEKQKVIDVVDACIARGIYVIIDWHSHDAHEETDDAVAFFEEMATKYGEVPNVMYEIYNEPEMIDYGSLIKPYSDRVVSAIRAIDPDNIIHVGTSFWSQKPDEAFSNPPLPSGNQVYSLHFYVHTHGESLRSSIGNWINSGIPLFINEWGIWGSLRSPQNLEAEFDLWLQAIRENKVGFTYWSVNDKVEQCKTTGGPNTCQEGWQDNAVDDYEFDSMLKNGTGGDATVWSDADFSDIGLKMKEFILERWNALDTLPEFDEPSGLSGAGESSSSVVVELSSSVLSSEAVVSSSEAVSSSSSSVALSSDEVIEEVSSEVESSSSEGEENVSSESSEEGTSEDVLSLYGSMRSVSELMPSSLVERVQVYGFSGKLYATISRVNFADARMAVSRLELNQGNYFVKYSVNSGIYAEIIIK